MERPCSHFMLLRWQNIQQLVRQVVFVFVCHSFGEVANGSMHAMCVRILNNSTRKSSNLFCSTNDDVVCLLFCMNLCVASMMICS